MLGSVFAAASASLSPGRIAEVCDQSPEAMKTLFPAAI